MPDLEKDLRFLYELGTLRFIKRAWDQFLGPGFANIAEHTFRIIWLALTIAKLENEGNQEKIMKMALVHDIVESRCGDTHHIARRYTKRDEDKAIKDMFSDLSLGEEWISLWQEAESKKTIEAQIVKDADNLDVDMEIAEQDAKGNKFRELYKDNREIVAEDYYTDSAKKLYKLIVDSNPHDWQKFSRSRFNEGDWKE